MGLTQKTNLSLSIFLLLLNPSLVYSDGDKDISSGAHSFTQLGSAFYEPLPMKKIPGARLVLFNHEAAKRMGLQVPKDPKKLEEWVLSQYAYSVAPPGEKSDKAFFATYYQDSGSREVGEARGDGRAAWAGEKIYRDRSGKTQAIDISVKGIGVTPMAWTGHDEESHKDGLQAMDEAVYSYIMSEANVRNQLDSTVDLAVIEIPSVKKETKGGAVPRKAAITIRAGTNTRQAHLRYHSNHPENFKKIFEYSLRRDLGLPPSTPITPKLVSTYQHKLIENLADESARYFDLHAVHGSTTSGNRTTQGSTIDMGTWRYLDGHHQNYTYLFNKSKVSDQFQEIGLYLNQLNKFAKEANYPLPVSFDQAYPEYVRRFKASLTRQWLRRVGFGQAEIEKIMHDKKVAEKFYNAVESLYEAEGRSEITYDRRQFIPAGFDVRNIMKDALATLEKSTDARSAQWMDTFKNKKPWATLNPEDYEDDIKPDFVAALAEAVRVLSPKGKIDPKWISQARLINGHERISRQNFVQTVETPILDAIQTGKSHTDITKMADAAIEDLVDPGLLARAEINSVARGQAIPLESPLRKSTRLVIPPCVGSENEPPSKLNQLINTVEKVGERVPAY